MCVCVCVCVCVRERERECTLHDEGHEGDHGARQLALIGSQDFLITRGISDGLE